MLMWEAKTAIVACARFFGPEGYNARRSTEYRGSNVDYLFHPRTLNSRPMATNQALSCTEGGKAGPYMVQNLGGQIHLRQNNAS